MAQSPKVEIRLKELNVLLEPSARHWGRPAPIANSSVAGSIREDCASRCGDSRVSPKHPPRVTSRVRSTRNRQSSRNASILLKINGSAPVYPERPGAMICVSFSLKNLPNSGNSQVTRQFADRFQQQIGTRCADALSCREGAEHANRTHSSAPRHLDIFRRVSHIDAIFGASAQTFQRQIQRSGMRLLARRVFAEDRRGEKFSKSKFGNLLADAVAASAGHQTQTELSRQRTHHATRARQQFRTLRAIRRAPKPASLPPFRPWHSRRAVDLIPVWAVVPLEFGFAPFDPQRTKHRHVRPRIRGVRIEKRAVPIEQNHARGNLSAPSSRLGGRIDWRIVHSGRIVPEVGRLTRARAARLRGLHAARVIKARRVTRSHFRSMPEANGYSRMGNASAN